MMVIPGAQEGLRGHSKDVRERVLRAGDQGRPRAEIVQIFGVSLAAIKRYGRAIPNHEKVARNVARVSGRKISPYPRAQYLAQYYARRYEPQSSRI